MDFIARINDLCNERKISKRQLEREAGLGAGSFSKWKTFTPNNTTMTKLANYFGVSMSYLAGESDYRTEQSAILSSKCDNSHSIKIPVLGRVAAGIPIDAIEDVSDWEEISEDIAKTGKFFGLKVKGDSMSPRIAEGDTLIVRQQPDAESGDVVIAQINGDTACVKRLLKHNDGIVLQSFNPNYEPMYFNVQEIIDKPVRILGKVVENRQKF